MQQPANNNAVNQPLAAVRRSCARAFNALTYINIELGTQKDETARAGSSLKCLSSNDTSRIPTTNLCSQNLLDRGPAANETSSNGATKLVSCPTISARHW
jgi:hypothetical protein